MKLFRSYNHQYFGKNIETVIMVWMRPFLIISIDFDVLILSFQDTDLNLILFSKYMSKLAPDVINLILCLSRCF